MISPIVDVLILAAIALFVLSRLYVALGRDDGDQPAAPERAPLKRPETGRVEPLEQQGSLNPHLDRPMFTGPAAAALEEIYEADNDFSPGGFVRGARSAYQVIVGAFAQGDRDALRPLLDDDVYEAWDAAITDRDASGTPAYKLLRIRNAEIEDAELDGRTARVMMRYEADLGDGEKTRVAREIWTFMRDTTSSDPNWLLDDVEVAN
jgi:predicted lipid-binding transport protein (Tim44 family)